MKNCFFVSFAASRVRLAAVLFALVGVFTIVSSSAAKSKGELDSFGGWTGIKGKKTGFFHVENIDGRDWFVTPEGNAFFAVALSHLWTGESDLAAKNVYGGDKDAFLKDTFEKAQAMGFNCALGSATSPERNLNGFVDVEKGEALFREKNFPYAVGVILLKHPWEFVDGETLPDIFDPSYKKLIESRAKEVCTKYRDDPLVMGYYYGFGAFNKSDQWINHHLSLPAGSPGRDAIVNVLKKQYGGDVKRFNAEYEMSLKSIDDLKSKAVLSYEQPYERRNYALIRQRLDPDKLENFEAIVSHMCINLYKMGHEAIRRYDRNHIILGSFIKEWALSADSWKKAAPYLDVMAPQHVNKSIDVNAIAKDIGLPIIFSDEYFGFHYPTKGKGHAAIKSHDARGNVYQANIYRHFKDAQVTGVTYCACMYDQGGNTLLKDNQNGFYSLDGEPRVNLIEKVTKINKEVYLHSTNPASPSELAKIHKTLFETWAANSPTGKAENF